MAKFFSGFPEVIISAQTYKLLADLLYTGGFSSQISILHLQEFQWADFATILAIKLNHTPEEPPRGVTLLYQDGKTSSNLRMLKITKKTITEIFRKN